MRALRTVVWGSLVVVGLLFLIPSSVGLAGASHAAPTTAFSSAPLSSGFNRPGDLLITDQFNNRVIEVNPLTKAIVWSFGSGNSTLCNPGPGAVIGPNWAERISGGLTILAGTGIPSGVAGTTACADNRVIIVNQAGSIVWQYGQAGKSGAGPNLLNVPTSAVQLPNHDLLITDQANNRVIEVNLHHAIVWSYGPTNGSGALNSPNSAELLKNGHILIADEGNDRVLEITRGGSIVWQYSAGLGATAFASRLASGDTLITDAGNNHVLEVTHGKHLVFQFFTNRSVGSNASPAPTNAVRLAGGDTIIADQFNNRVIVISTANHIVFQYGVTNVAGSGFNELFAPYTAFVIGDYTGQTVPPATFR
ncbi:MAG: hypothetical protein L3J91_00705 [Thermoplasmata archaeon]|nr:hypothetical protein [Thermoplasmata archaeon]